jgi:hypothetical protein
MSTTVLKRLTPRPQPSQLRSIILRGVPRREYAAYGYEQAKSLVFHQTGEPKDVLK